MSTTLNNLNQGIEPITAEEYKTDLSTLSNLKFEKIQWYTKEYDFGSIDIDKQYKEMNGDNPKYVEFNNEPYTYEKALVKAINEVYDMFKDCNSYEEARKVITTIDPLNLCSEDRGYNTEPGTTGRLYGCWVIINGRDEDETICWDARWY